ncbi:MAG: hypothetical protein P8R54_23160, partial [Myxococcota bacterium]|nr:hypothetical protein [Myxococcota bacterium]
PPRRRRRRGPGGPPGGPRRGPPPHLRRRHPSDDRFSGDRHPDDHPLDSEHPDAVNDPRYSVPPHDRPRRQALRPSLPRVCPSCSGPVMPGEVNLEHPQCAWCGVLLTGS